MKLIKIAKNVRNTKLHSERVSRCFCIFNTLISIYLQFFYLIVLFESIQYFHLRKTRGGKYFVPPISDKN